MERQPSLISVVVPVSRDLRIKECLESIDFPAEIIVVLNNQPAPEVIRIVERDVRCRSLYLPGRGCNLAQAFNLGIEAASQSKVVLTNSDCRFSPGLLEEISCGLESHEVVKARVDFDYGNYGQFLVAETRRLFHQVFDSGTKLFGPGLAFRKEIKTYLGGYFFDERMGWGEDGDLSRRIHASRRPYLIATSRVKHGSEGVRHDLKVAFRIGRGNRAKEAAEGKKLRKAWREDFRHLATDHHQQFRTAHEQGGWPLLLYFLLWKLSFHLGYYTKNRKETSHG